MTTSAATSKNRFKIKKNSKKSQKWKLDEIELKLFNLDRNSRWTQKCKSTLLSSDPIFPELFSSSDRDFSVFGEKSPKLLFRQLFPGCVSRSSLFRNSFKWLSPDFSFFFFGLKREFFWTSVSLSFQHFVRRRENFFWIYFYLKKMLDSFFNQCKVKNYLGFYSYIFQNFQPFE